MTAAEIVSGSLGSSTPVLKTGRLVLRAPSVADVPAIARLANNRKIAEMTALIPHPYSATDAEGWVKAATGAESGATFGIFFAKDNAFIGACGYAVGASGSLACDPRVPELGYWIGEPYWNQGFATEAARALIDYAFATAGLEALGASARVTNQGSRRVLEKCGFQWTGAGLCRVKALGASVPSDRFRLDRNTWQSLRAWGATALPKVKKSAR